MCEENITGVFQVLRLVLTAGFYSCKIKDPLEKLNPQETFEHAASNSCQCNVPQNDPSQFLKIFYFSFTKVQVNEAIICFTDWANSWHSPSESSL